MSLNERLKGLIFLLCLFLTGLIFIPSGNASANTFNYSPDDNYFQLNAFQYDESGKIYIDVQLKTPSTYNMLVFPYSVNPDWDNVYVYYNKPSPRTDFYLGRGSGTYSSWYCETSNTGTVYSTSVYGITTSPVKCFPKTLYSSYKNDSYVNHWIYNASGITKTDIDNYYGGNFLENNFSIGALSGTETIFRMTLTYNFSSSISQKIYTLSQTEPSLFPFLGTPLPVNGLCGGDDGQYISHAPPTAPLVLCQSGTPTSTIYWNPTEQTWFWGCLGDYGGTDDYCIAYLTSEPVNAVCGADSGQTLSEPPDDFCSSGYLITPTYLETITGYSWQCGGYNGGDNVLCTASKGGLTPPPIPETEDCSVLSVPDRWFCQISNAIQNAFLPSPEKLNDLNEVLNGIQAKFPFNYISVASDKFQQISSNITEGTLSLTIMGNTGNVNLTALSGFNSTLKMMSGFLIILMFIFWAIGYIKHFFK